MLGILIAILSILGIVILVAYAVLMFCLPFFIYGISKQIKLVNLNIGSMKRIMTGEKTPDEEKTK